jgi:cytochrome P450
MSLQSTGDPPVYDPLSLEEDPYPVYRELRTSAPVYRGEHPSVGLFWALSRFDDVQRAARSWELLSSAEGNDLDDTGSLFGPAPAMDLCDPPVHTIQRRAMRSDFSLRNVRSSLAALAAEEIDRILNDLLGRESVDFARNLAYPLPANLILRWLGFPRSDFAQIRDWHRGMLERNPGQRELPQRAVDARNALWGYLGDALDERCRKGGNDLLASLAHSHRRGMLSREEALANALFFFDAGIVSTNALISNWFLHMNSNRDQLALVEAQKNLIPAAIEEMLRFDAPFHWFTRVATADVVINETTIPAGGRVVLIWASANRDERRWKNSESLKVTREHLRHLSFSDGIHHCLGAPLARLEVKLLFEKLLPLIEHYELTAPPVRRVTPSERTIVSLPARLSWRT